MVTDDERHEVARVLRELSGLAFSPDNTYELMADAMGFEDFDGTDELFSRLADLIAPKGIESEAFNPVECDGFDREALLALADELDSEGLDGWASGPVGTGLYARRIRKALGVES